MVQLDLFDPLPVDKRSVPAPQVADEILPLMNGDFRLRAGYVHVGKNQVVAGTAPDRESRRYDGRPTFFARFVQKAEPGLNGTFLMGDETSGSLLHAAVEILFSQRKEHGVSGSSMPCIQSCRDRYLFVNHDYRKSGAQTGDAPELFGPGRSRQRLQIAQVEFRVLKDFFRFAQSRGRHNAVPRSLKVFAREDLGLRPQPYEQDVILGRHDC